MQLHVLPETHGDVKHVWGRGLSGEAAVPGWAGGDRPCYKLVFGPFA